MKKFLYILILLALAVSVAGCKSKDKKVDKVMANKEEFIRIALSSGRPGIESVIAHLDTTDFYTRGAGRHHTEEGGLVQHSLEVYKIMRCVAWFQKSDAIIICALFHDMGKIDYGGWHPWRSAKHLRDWGLEISDKEFNSIFYHHKPGWKYYYHYPLRRALSFSDAISTGWWKLWHKSPKDTDTE